MIARSAFVVVMAAGGALARPDVPQYSAKQFYETVAIAGASFSPDEAKVLVSSDESGVFNAYAIPVSGGRPVRLTDSKDNAMFGLSYFPKDERILVSSDQGGNELTHLYVRELNGSLHDLTPGDNLKAEFLDWAGNDRAFYVISNERDPQYFDVHEYAADGYSHRMLYENAGGFTPMGISPDGKWLCLLKNRNNADSTLFVINLTNAEANEITPHEGNIVHGFSAFTPDSRAVYFLSNSGGEWDHLRSYVLEGLPAGQKNHQVVEQAPWDIMYSAFSRNGQWRVTAVNADARTEITVRDAKTNGAVTLPAIPRGDITGVTFSRSGKKMAFYVNGDTSPSNLYVMDMPGGAPKKLTSTLNPAMKQEHLVESQVVRYRSFDGTEIPAILYKPHGASASNPAPALVWVHGGPGGQTRTGYSALIQFLVNHGYAVLGVNHRGSSGYGKTFFHADDRDHGGGDLQDCVHGRKYLESLDWVDDSRVGIIGGSYGGYMVCAALCFEPEAFDVGIDIFGVTNWIRTLEEIPPWWAAFREDLYTELGDPATDKERLLSRSPLAHADRIVKPIMVIQGANDPRVQKAESDEIVAAVTANGVPCEYVVFPDEGHGFLKKENRITAAEQQLEFLERYLRGK